MRCLLTLIVLTIATVAAPAQKNIYLSFHTGAMTNKLTFLEENVYTYDSRNTHATFDLRLWKEFNNKWQAGVSLETGMLRNNVDFRAVVFNNAQLPGDVSFFNNNNVISPCLVPNVFGNYKLNMPKGNFMYAGIMAGVITGSNDMAISTMNITTPVAGANLGISFSLGKAAYFSIYHGYRFTHVNMPDDLQYLVPRTANNNTYSYYTLSDFNMHYVVNGISIVYRF